MIKLGGGVSNSKSKIISAILGFLCAAVFFCGFFAIKNTQKAEALTSTGDEPTGLTQAKKISNGDDLWDDTNQCFSSAIYDLLLEVFDSVTTDPATYIQDTNNGAVTDTGSTLITASTLNAKAGSDYGYVVKLGGLYWMIASLTVADVGTATNQPIMTLYLADTLMNSSGDPVATAFLADSLAGNNLTKGRDMYASSTVRNKLISATADDYKQLALFTGTSSFAQNYLVQPKYIAYQRQQTQRGRTSPYENANYNLKNEALENPSGGAWYSNGGTTFSYAPSFTYNGSASGGLNAQCDAWGSDYIWLPSFTEVGSSNYLSTSCIWKLSNEQRKSSYSCWTRSSNYNTFCYPCTVEANAVAAGRYPNQNTSAVRPAIHLNLNEAIANAKLLEPETTELTYTKDTPDYSKQDWYRACIHDDTSLCTITYKNNKTGQNLSAAPTTVGEYTVTFKLLLNDFSWTGTSASKIRTMTLTIKPKKLEVDFDIDPVTDIPTIALFEDPIDGDTVNCSIRYFDKAKDDETRTDLGTDSSVLKGKTWYYAAAEFDNPNYVPNLDDREEEEIHFFNPAARVKASWMSASPEYTGSAQRFILLLSGGKATASLKKDYGDDVKQTTATQFTAVNAGKYTVVLSLTNKDEYVWDDTGTSDDYEFDFEITPKTVTLNIASLASEITEGYNTSAQVELLPITSGTLRVILCAYYQNNFIDYLCAIDLNTANTHFEPFTLETANLLSPFTYDLQFEYDDPDDLNARNHKIVLDTSYSITVKEPSLAGGLNWRLTSGGSVVGNKADPADTNSTIFTDKITYSGKSYSFTVNAAGIGYSVDTAYNDNDFTSGYKTVKKGTTAALSSVTDAGTYVTTVHLINGADTAEYSIEWTIDKAKFDLSGVRWLPKDGAIEYSANMSIVIDPDTLPEGLSVKQYGGSFSVSSVGQVGTASVIFEIADSDNYVLPVSTDNTTYKFTAHDGLTDFEWEKDWEVVPAEIPIVWTVGTVTASGNKKVNAKVLDGGYDAYLDYVYYESDSRGIVAEGATPISELSIIEGTVKYYVAEVSVKPNFNGQYVLEAGKSNRSGVFEVGHTLTAVQLQAKKTAYTYWGQPVIFQFKVTQGTVTEDAFEITYYKGTLRQVNPPTDVGTYTARISLKNNYTNNYYIDGDYAFEYTIERAVIKIDWNTGTKPPALKLTAEEKACVSYEYCDSTGNTVSLNTMRVTPATYNVRAVIKSASAKNYIFNNNSTATDWQQFTVASGDLITDPEMAAPFNPSVDPNGTDTVSFYLASLTGAAGTAPQVQNSAGLSLNVDYVIAYYKDGEPVGDFSAAGNYEIRITLIGIAASQYRLEGDTLMYTVVGGTLDGTTTNPNGEGDNPSDATIVSYLPIILSGVSLVLIIVFLVMTLNNLSAAKEAKAKTKKLATMSYSFAPTGLLAIVLGLSEGNWWIIAGVLMGLALLMAIAAFMSKSKKKKALAALEEEQERIAEEKEYARLEEQQRRDNEMKMMFAAMQQQGGGGGYAQPMYDDAHIQNLIASTVSALLPTIQQQMALPPAQSDTSVYGVPNPEVDALRAQLAEQQELLKQVLENQQSQQYEPYEEEVVDDLSWLGESDELISLEESYGALSDEGKRAYYEIGSYIMCKPRTSQNDGRYAVLFKYRGRTIFKLAIKDDAPVLYYPAGGGRAEVRVIDGSSLEVAKGMIDRTVSKVDSELN